MKKTLLLSGLLLISSWTIGRADDSGPSPRLLRLIKNLPAVGQFAAMADLGLSLKVSEQEPLPVSQDAASYDWVVPRNLDRDRTDRPPLAGHYPGLHLNLPLKVEPGYVNHLFLSDQPERIRDDRLRNETTPGATGVYARTTLPAAATARILVDHTNGTQRPLHYYLLWIPEQSGWLAVQKRGQAIKVDSVAAGRLAFEGATAVAAEPRLELSPDHSVTLAEARLKPEETVVLHMQMFSSVGGQLVSLVSEDEQPPPANLAAMDALPVLHSIVWKEEESRLSKFIDIHNDPKRFARILESPQHARGDFHFPDRCAYVDYKVGSWSESDSPTQLYSLFESIPGSDATSSDQAANPDNRGSYGAREGLKIKLQKLPPDCHEMALVALNTADVFGGRHSVSDGRTDFETYLYPGIGPGLLRTHQVCTLWRGPVVEGETLNLWLEPMANISVHLLYALIPIPPASP